MSAGPGYIALPAAIGLVADGVARRFGYDIGPLHGAAQAILVGLTARAFFSPSLLERGDTLEFFDQHPYSAPVLLTGLIAGLYSLSGWGMGYLIDKDVSQGFTTIVGGLEGAVMGGIMSTTSRMFR